MNNSENKNKSHSTNNENNAAGNNNKNRNNRSRRNRHRNGKDFRKERKPESSAGTTKAAPAVAAPAIPPEYIDYVPYFEKKEEELTESEIASAAEEPLETVEVIGVRFKDGGKIYFFSPAGIAFMKNDRVIVETVRGLEFGFVAAENKMVPVTEVFAPLKSVVRKATPQDESKHQENKETEKKAALIWEEKIKANNLEMQLVDVEITFDNTKLIFYFTADGRVDFRDLVKDLASIFRTRIELRQIGVRDEAKLFGGMGICGRVYCCKSYLADFVQVSIKMAKEQNLSLSSSKISGACGRLMCCLRYEHDVYELEYATFPKIDTIVDTPSGRGVIIESNFLTGNIKVRMNNENAVKVFKKDDLKMLGVVKIKDEAYGELKELEK